MADAFRQQLRNTSMSALSFEERFGMLVEAEYSRRRDSLMDRLFAKAGLKIGGACMEGIEYHPDRKLDKELLSSLATCSYIRERRDVILVGATGAGKTYIACALGNAACRNYNTVRYMRFPELLTDLSIDQGGRHYQEAAEPVQEEDLAPHTRRMEADASGRLRRFGPP